MRRTSAAVILIISLLTFLLDLMDAQAQVPQGNAEMEKWHRKAAE